MAIDGGREHLNGLAKAQRWLLALFFGYFAAAVAYFLIPQSSPASPVIAVLTGLAWLLMLAMVVAVTRHLAGPGGGGGGWGWAIVVLVLMLIPLINLLTLLAVNQRAVRRLKEAGFTVGLMGVPKEQMG